MKLAIASDHGGFDLKTILKEHLVASGHEIIDFGTNSKESCNYPDYALAAARAVQSGLVEKGVLICTSGEGISIAANKVKGIRCGIAYNEEVARLIVEHNNCNMIAFGAKYFTKEEAIKMLDIFLSSSLAEGRHAHRVDLIAKYEEEHHC